MYTYTIVCFGAEIGYGQGETFEKARCDAESSINHSEWYPKSEWGYVSAHPSGMIVEYNV